jgi:hypothetical protein
MNWIKITTRMAIYARDHFDCVWCRQVFPIDITGYGLSLDHLTADGNHHTNLVTCCNFCNTSRHTQSLDTWLRGHRVRRRRMQRAVALPIDQKLGRALAHHRKGGYDLSTADMKQLSLIGGDRAAQAAAFEDDGW